MMEEHPPLSRNRPGWRQPGLANLAQPTLRPHIATVEVEGALGVQAVDARPSDALNLAALVQEEAKARRAGDSPEAAHLRATLAAPPMTVGTVGM
jgi:hypothetical protein